MTPKPYKENKSSLKAFLEKNNLASVPKEDRGKLPRKHAVNKYYLVLKRLAEYGTEEDKARLEAVGFDLKLVPDKKINRYQWERVSTMEGSDGHYGPGLWQLYYFNKPRPNGYYVAGKRYESREHFLLSRTGLGRELL